MKNASRFLMLFTIGMCVFTFQLSAQKTLLPFDRVTSHDALRQLYESDSIIHLSFKPLLLNRSEVDTLIERTNNRYTTRKQFT